MTLGNSLSVANDWGSDGRLASRRLYRTSGGANVSLLGYGYDDNDNITSIIDQLNDAGSVYYGYDKADRLSVTALTSSAPATGTDTYSYTSGTNRLASIAGNGGARTFSYDNRGNLSGATRPGSISATTAYDGYGRLTSYARTDVGTLTFAYNGRDDRITSSAGGVTRRFVYDADGRVLGEYGSSATNVRAEFIWLTPALDEAGLPFGGDDGAGGYMPLAVATPNSSGTIVLNWVHGNHMGVPLVTTDSTGATATTPNDYLAPGFPGQSRALSDLYYNRYRDYDTTTGRYIQADPIGLEGGQNPYAYAENNPMRWSDPWGLMSVWTYTSGRIGGWVVGSAAAAACAELGPGALACGLAGRYVGRRIGEAVGAACEGAILNNDSDKPYEGETPDDKPGDFKPLGRPGKKAPPKIKESDGSVWESDRDGHGGSKWKRWPSVRDWEKSRGVRGVRPNGSFR